MKLNPLGLLRLKPFDESKDDAIAASVYRRLPVIVVLLTVAGILAASAMLVSPLYPMLCRQLLGVFVAISCIGVGIQWHAGLKATALNGLLTSVVLAGAFYLTTGSQP